jgi:hypothetical protein
VFGRKELEQFRLQKQALVLESSLNRHALRAEFQNLRSAAAWMSNATRAPRQLAPLWVVLAPLAGFFLVRSFRRPHSLFNRVAAAAKWIGPLYTLWQRFSVARKKGAEAA